MKKIGFIILKSLNLLSFYSLKKSGYLHENGWFSTFKSKASINIKNNPIPWMNYSFIHFIEERLNNKMNIFEFGCGNSTLWWHKQVNSIVAVESDKGWFDKIKNSLPNEVSLTLKNLKNQDYSNELLKFSKTFNIICIDGRDRVNCAKNSLNALTDDGVIIWDNSDRKKYSEGYDFLTSNGFKRIDFRGIGPINVTGCTTSIFYKPNNCLGI